ncbi:MAG: response regulator [Lachnospiraceae bacterium]|nr:response regulator [Lachnospiraceae bacterium]
MDNKKNIVIVLYQYSVVVKGIERKLKEMDFNVQILSENIDDHDTLERYAMNNDTFILYLPPDINENNLRRSEMTDIIETVKEVRRSIVLIGEKKDHEELSAEVPGVSSCRWFDRPVDVAALANAIEKGDFKPVASDGKKRVLIVDDDPSYAGMVREWIRDMYHVDIVTAGMQAITFLVKNKVDLILLDYEMPIIDGPQVLQMLRQEESTKDIPVVFLTGVGTKEEVARVISLKPNGYILKSTTREDLINSIKTKIA